MLNRGDVDPRIDPEYYVYKRTIESFAFEALPLKRFLKSRPMYGANEIGIDRFDDQAPRYIRITDIDAFGQLINEDFGKTADTIESRFLLNNNDVLFARSGNTVGKAYLHKTNSVTYPCFFAGYMIRFVVDESQLLPDFVFYFAQTRFYKNWVSGIKRTAGQPNINAEEYKSLLLPIPPMELQHKMVSIFEIAYQNKSAKCVEADEKLGAIDTLVLDELGIILQDKIDNSLSSRMFFTKSGLLSGGRTDPHAQHPERVEAVEAVHSSKYPVEPLHVAAKFVGLQTNTNDLNHPYIGLNSIQSNTGMYLPKTDEPEEFGSANIFKPGNVLFPKLRPYLNKVHYATFDGVCSTEFHVLNGVKVSSQFLAIFLRTSVVVNQTKRLMTGNTLPRLQTADIESLLIPIPPTDVQNEIVEKVNAIYTEAIQLREEGFAILESAKAEVERMILAGG